MKSFEANPWGGLCQVHDNVYEWCQAWFGEYPEGEQVNRTGRPEAGDARVPRDGDWGGDDRHLRAGYRSGLEPGFRDVSPGFRLAAGQSDAQHRARRV